MPSPPEPARRGGGASALDATRLTRILAEDFDLDVVAFDAVDGGWDAAASVWSAVDSDGVRWSVKATRRDVDFGLHVASTLAASGAEGVLAPRRTRDGAVIAHADGFGIVVSAWIDGVDAVDVAIDDIAWERLGRTLRAVHDHPAETSAPGPRRGIRRLRRAPRALLRELGERFERIDRDDEGAHALRERWLRALPRLEMLAATERTLKRSRTPTARVTLHGDPHLGNVVVDAEGRPWLIDFDEAAIAPREVDLMLVELGVLFSKPIRDEHRSRFRDGYGRDADVDELRIVRFGCVRAIEDVVITMRRALDGGDAAAAAPVVDGLLGPEGLVTLVEHELRRLGHAPTRGSGA